LVGTRDVLNIIHDCDERSANVTVLDPFVTTKGEMGRMVLTVLGMVAQMERRSIKERQREGIARAKVAGAYKGGKKRLDRSAAHLLRRGQDTIAHRPRDGVF
jgi:DNA invertase Pin-like site-specific DNA recombinase